MNNKKLLTISIIVLFFVTVGVFATLGENSYFLNDETEFENGSYGENNTTVIIEFFVSAVECDPCEDAKEVVASDIEPFYLDNITIKEYPVSYSEENKENLEKWRSYGFESIPSIVIINTSSKNISKLSYEDIITPNYLKSEVEKQLYGNYSESPKDKEKNIEFFGFGINLNDFSLPVLTIVLAGIDSINPCSFFVLLFLLSILLYTKSRKRMILIGSIFIFMSGLIYFLLMTAILSVIQYIGIQMIIFFIAGIIAMIFGGLNIKDFFYFKKGPSASISDEKKKGLFKQIRKITKIKSMPSLLIASVIFAVSANTVDLLCSFNLPVIYTSVLSSYEFSGLEYYSYIFFYNVIYVLPLLIIALIMILTLG